MLKLYFVFSLLFTTLTGISQTDGPRLIRRVSASQTQIAFESDGKIWVVGRNGGTAKRLTSTSGDESDPVFSPDGKRIAFSRTNGRDFEVYVIPADGNEEARRLTYHGESDFVTNWTPDGKSIIFAAPRDERRLFRLYKIAADGGSLAESLPLPQALDGSLSPDGKQIAYNPRVFIFGEWRYYRGGMTSPIWLTDLASGATEKLTDKNVNDKNPMWIGDKIYFNSDRSGAFNLFVYDRASKQTKQLTNFSEPGIRTASASNGIISFVRDGRIYIFDPADGKYRTVNISFSPDRSELAPREVNIMQTLENALPSFSGDKIAISGRGESIVYEVSTGRHENLTNTPHAAERYSSISPDNNLIAYFSDESGEYQLHLRSLKNGGVRKIPIEKDPTFYRYPVWSPDSKRIVFCDRHLDLWLTDAESGTTTKIDTSDDSNQSEWRTSFSPDSRFLAYSKRLKNRAGTVFIYDLTKKRSFQITDGITHAESPVFDANGKYLYFISSPNALTSEYGWGVLNGINARPLVVRNVRGFALTRDASMPFLPDRQPNPAAKVSDPAGTTEVDFDDPDKRFFSLPVPDKDYSQIIAGRSGKVFLVVTGWGDTPGDPGSQQSTTIYKFDVAKPGEMQKIVGDIGGYEITQDGAKLLYIKRRNWFFVDAENPAEENKGRLDLSNMTVKTDPAREWEQIFHESTRIMRDWFYDPNHHGQDLVKLEAHYRKYLPNITRRRDLNTLIEIMLGSVSVSHLNVGGGDVPRAEGDNTSFGMLGADFAVENGKFRFKKILRSTSFASANGEERAPLDQKGVEVREGDYLLAVNDTKVETSKNLISYFRNTVDKPTKITVSSDPDGAGPREYTVYPVLRESRIRRSNWAEENRRLVEKLSGGKLGYIFIEDFGFDGVTNAVRGLSGYADKEGVIIDQRFNFGGITPDSLIEWMQRKPLYHYAFRAGDDIATPVNPAPPVKVLITNEWNGSAAETHAFMFKLGKVGSIVGKRTGGAGVGSYFFHPRFIDGGRIQLPNRAAYVSDGSSWGIENLGIEPDIDVEIMPEDLKTGRDPQLQKAIEEAMRKIAQTPAAKPKRPKFPVHPN
ncbi:MAG: PDZ domain-containing protein [Pyrinomonadaceae bacterium]